jgi:redox-sensitive bicupin YhaK (pirin superfamily)
LISGNWSDQEGPADSLTNLMMSWIDLQTEGSFEIEVDTGRTVFFYVVRGKVEVNGVSAQKHNLVEFENDNPLIKVQAMEESTILFGHGEPFNEPVVAQGPFVMNSREEIMQAYEDFQSGKMGTWE